MDRRATIKLVGGAAAALVADPTGALAFQATSKARIPMPGYISDHPRARALIRIGDEAIAKENPAMLRAFFAEDFVFHGPNGDRDFDQLSSHFASLRAAFSDFRLGREQILVDGDHTAARTSFSGVFTGVFTQSPIGTLQPTGKHVRWEAMNIFRYDSGGRLAEEWVQTDYRSMLVKLGVPPA